MTFTASDVVPLTQARATLSDLVEQVKAGAEKIITKNGESYVAIIDSRRLDYYHQLERERIHLLLIDDAGKGLDDIAAGKVKDARSTLATLPLVKLTANFERNLEEAEAFLLSMRLYTRLSVGHICLCL